MFNKNLATNTNTDKIYIFISLIVFLTFFADTIKIHSMIKSRECTGVSQRYRLAEF